MLLNMSNKKRFCLLLSPFLIIFLGFSTAAIFSGFLDGWAWIPLAIVYWGSLYFCSYYFKGAAPIKIWLGKARPSKLWVALSLLTECFP